MTSISYGVNFYERKCRAETVIIYMFVRKRVDNAEVEAWWERFTQHFGRNKARTRHQLESWK